MFDYSLFVDCGAPSLYNKLSKQKNSSESTVMGSTFANRKYDDYSYADSPAYMKYLDSYIEYLSEHKGDIDIFSSLDVINNPKLSWRNLKRMEKAGLKPIPVYHLSNKESDYKWLDRLLANYEYIAIGGLIPNKTEDLIPFLDRLFSQKLVDKDGMPKAKFHGFACTAKRLMVKYPWYSVDSATCMKLGVFGQVLFPEFTSFKMKNVMISSRSINDKWQAQMTPNIWRTILRHADRVGLDTDMQTLVDSRVERAIFNYMMVLDCLTKEIPAWPWSYTTRESAPGANEFLRYYFAGAANRVDELYFWKKISTVSKLDLTGRKHRLISYFYKNQVTFMRNLRKGIIAKPGERI